jgi:hypothetical protein
LIDQSSPYLSQAVTATLFDACPRCEFDPTRLLIHPKQKSCAQGAMSATGQEPSFALDGYGFAPKNCPRDAHEQVSVGPHTGARAGGHVSPPHANRSWPRRRCRMILLVLNEDRSRVSFGQNFGERISLKQVKRALSAKPLVRFDLRHRRHWPAARSEHPKVAPPQKIGVSPTRRR